jgi:hypothetical protein
VEYGRNLTLVSRRHRWEGKQIELVAEADHGSVVLLLDTVCPMAPGPVYGEYRGCREFRNDATLVMGIRYLEALDDRFQHSSSSATDVSRTPPFQYLKNCQTALWQSELVQRNIGRSVNGSIQARICPVVTLQRMTLAFG